MSLPTNLPSGPIRRLVAVGVLALAGCAHGPAAHTTPPPARSASVRPVASDEQLAAVRDDFFALPLDAAERAPMRQAIIDYILLRVGQLRTAGHLEEAFEGMKTVLALFDPSELRRPIDEPQLAAAAAELEKGFRQRGAHQEVLTLLAAEIALTATAGTATARLTQLADWLLGSGGATPDPEGRDRLIDDLEAVARVWPSPAIVDLLARQYVARPRDLRRDDGCDRAPICRRCWRQAAARLRTI